MILSGDIGGTKAELALYEPRDGRLVERHARRVATDAYPSLEDLIVEFLSRGSETIESAAFGIAGPVVHNRVVGTNLPWVVEEKPLARRLGLPRVEIVNDLEATAFGLAALTPDEVVTLEEGRPDPEGSIAVIAAGTGLGEAMLTTDDGVTIARASEGGHRTYSPRTETEIDLMRYLSDRFGGHVSWERVVSGPGLSNIYEFLRDTGRAQEPAWLAAERASGDPNVAIAQADGKAEIATLATDLFVDAYGAEAGNLALQVLATGGVYVAGGIAPKMRERLSDGRFLAAFRDKGRLGPLLARIPVRLVLNERTALLGAAGLAWSRAAARTP
ncbi:MAG: glucokinase [Candidatus Eiseniibacteriota bacterium]